jgi:DNA adenine methylase
MPSTSGGILKIKPIIKLNDSKNHLVPWILDKFPEGYQNMTYLEPFLGSGSVLLNKDPSQEEVANDLDSGIIEIWRAARDEPKAFASKIKRMGYKEATFSRCQRSAESDYLARAVCEFVLRQMSKSGLKKVYLPKDGDVKCKDCWHSILERVPEIRERIGKIHLLNKDALAIIRAFSHENSLVYCDPPEPEEGGSMDSNRHIELSEILREFRGKAIISARNCSLYKRLYAGWNRRGVPGRNESIWLNF